MIRETYSSVPPTIAPRRLAANAVPADSTPENRCAKTRLARKTGANASALAARNRGTAGSPSSDSCGTIHATARAAMSAPYSTAAGGSRTHLAVSTARYTARRTPAKTREFTNQVVPNSSANCTMLLVSSSRKAAPMNARSR